MFLRCITPPAVDEEAFSKNIYNHTALYIPNGSWDEYVFNSNWYQFINIHETTTVEGQLSMQQAYTLMDAFFDSRKQYLKSLSPKHTIIHKLFCIFAANRRRSII